MDKHRVYKYLKWVGVMLCIISNAVFLTPIAGSLGVGILEITLWLSLVTNVVFGILLYLGIRKSADYGRIRSIISIVCSVVLLFVVFRVFGSESSDFYSNYTASSKVPVNSSNFLFINIFFVLFILPIVIDFAFLFSGKIRSNLKYLFYSIALLLFFIAIITAEYVLASSTLNNYLTKRGFVAVSSVSSLPINYNPEIAISNSLYPIAGCLQTEKSSIYLKLIKLIYGDTKITSRQIKIFIGQKCLAIIYPDKINSHSENILEQTVAVAELLIKLKYGKYLSPEASMRKPKAVFLDEAAAEYKNIDGYYDSRQHTIFVKPNSFLLRSVLHETLHASVARVFSYAYNDLSMEEAMTTYLSRELMSSINVPYETVEYSKGIVEAFSALFDYTDKDALISAYFSDDLELSKIRMINQQVDARTYENAMCVFVNNLDLAVKSRKTLDMVSSDFYAKRAIQSLRGSSDVSDIEYCPF